MRQFKFSFLSMGFIAVMLAACSTPEPETAEVGAVEEVTESKATEVVEEPTAEPTKAPIEPTEAPTEPAVEALMPDSEFGLLEVITVELAEGATLETFLPANQVIEDEYASQQLGYIARETATNADGVVRLSVHWQSKADSDASIAGFGEAPGLGEFMGNLDGDTMVIKQYELMSSSSGQTVFPGAGATEAITVRLQDGADVDGFLAANQAIEESYVFQQPGFIARETAVTEDGEWLIVVHWATAEDSAASIAGFGEAPGVEDFMSFIDAETMAINVFEIQNKSAAGLIEVITVNLADGATTPNFLQSDKVIETEYASLQSGFLARETAINEDGLVRLAVHWESKADSDASIAGFGEAPGLETFMGNLNGETMVIKQYEMKSSSSGQTTFPDAGATEAITVRLQEGADVDGFLAANQAIEESYVFKQPGFIARETAVTEDGEWLIVVHWATAEDSAASISGFGEAPGVEDFMSFIDAETMSVTVFEIQKHSEQDY